MPTSIPQVQRLLTSSTRHVLWLSAAVSLLVLVIAAATLVIVSRELDAARESRRELGRTRQALEQLQSLFSTLQDAQIGERGFVITGRSEFLAPYHAAERSLDGQLVRLQQLLIGPDAAASLARLSELSKRQMTFLGAVIELRRASGTQAAADLIGQQQGREQIEEIRTLVNSMHAREERRMTARLATYQQRSSDAASTVRGALGGAIVLVFVAGLLLTRHVGRRLEAEDEARAAYELLREIMDNVTQGIAVFDKQRRLLAWNSRYLELRGLDTAKVRVGMDMAEIIAVGSPFTVSVGGGAPQRLTKPRLDAATTFESEATRSDGTVLLVRGRPIRGSDSIVTYTDITALKTSEMAYRDQAARLTATLDNVVDAIITINESGSIESWSKGAERLFGYEAHEVIRHNVRMLMPDPHASAHDGYIRRYIMTGERRIIGQRREVEGRHKDGRIIPVDLGISEMHIGARRMFIGVIRDISARLEVDRLKSGFVSTVSHELRTPLTSISGSLGLLAAGVVGELPPKATRLIDIARLNSERLVRLINDILDLEKAESGRLDLRLESQRLKPIVQQAIDLNRAYAQGFGASIELDPRSGDTHVLVDRDRLIQVLTNLLSNAAKFSPRGGTIHVSITNEEDSVRVSIRDQGPGLPAEFRQRVFQKFAQADSSDSRAKGGTGLGLSIAKTIMERLGGAIGFDSAVSTGALFYISLPAKCDVSPTRPLAAANGTCSGSSALICEDDPDVALILAEMLRNEGMRAEAVSSAKAARAALAAVRFDMAIVDLHLPDADGLEFIAELRSREATRALPVIVVTARCHAESDQAVVGTLQLADWLRKPIDPQRLLDTIRGVLLAPRVRRPRILHVEDDASLTKLVRELLDQEADVAVVSSLAQARHMVRDATYDLVILDVTLNDGSGLDLLPQLHDAGRTPPVILYSATEPSREISDKVQAALVKSRDSMDELLANVRALIRR